MLNDDNTESIINPDVEAPKKLDLEESYKQYRKTLYYMGANVPLQVLCLPKTLEKLLLKEGILRVYDLIGRNFTEIKGVGDRSNDLLTARLNEFLSVSI